MRGSPYFAHPVLDAETYHRAALALAGGEGFPDRVFWQPPGYPYFLALVYALAGPSFLAPRLVQAVLGSLAAVLTYWLGARLFGPRVGLAAGLGAAGYGLLIYYDGELLTPSLAILVELVAVLLAVRAQDAPDSRSWLGAGLFGGLAAVVNATALVLVPVMAVFARRRALWVLLGAALAIAPLTLRNWTQGGELVLISSNGGVNLFLGNNPRYDDTVAMRPGRDWQALLRAPRLHGVRGARAESVFFERRVLAFARAEPVTFLRLQATKLRLLLTGDEIPRNQEIYPARGYSPVLRVLLWKSPLLAFPYGIVLPLGLVGLVVGARRAPMLAAMLVVFALAVLAFFVTARYRAPLVPLLLVFAAEGLRWLVASASRTARLVAVGALVPLYAVANLGQGPMPAQMNPDAEFGLATWLEREGSPDEALALYRAVAREHPSGWDAWYRLGQLLEAAGRREEAEDAFTIARGIVPTHFDTLVWLARQASEAGCLDEALAHYRRAVELDPTSHLARDGLERVLGERAKTPSTGSTDPCARKGPDSA